MRIWLKWVFYLVVVPGISVAQAGVYEDFFIAVKRGDDRTVEQLVQRGFDPNSPDEKGQTALHLALRDDAPQVAEALLRSPALKVDTTNASGETALMFAAIKGNLDWTRRLLERGAQSHRSGWSPIHYAASGPQPAVVALLLDRGAPIDAESPNRSTPLMMAARYGAPASVDLLLARGADPKRRNDLDLTAVDFARQAGRDALAEQLQRTLTR